MNLIQFVFAIIIFLIFEGCGAKVKDPSSNLNTSSNQQISIQLIQYDKDNVENAKVITSTNSESNTLQIESVEDKKISKLEKDVEILSLKDRLRDFQNEQTLILKNEKTLSKQLSVIKEEIAWHIKNLSFCQIVKAKMISQKRSFQFVDENFKKCLNQLPSFKREALEKAIEKGEAFVKKELAKSEEISSSSGEIVKRLERLEENLSK